jgi:hypothetical protein
MLPLSSPKTLLFALLANLIFSCNTKTDKQQRTPNLATINKDSGIRNDATPNYVLLETALDKSKVLLQSYTLRAKEKSWVTAKKGFKIFIDPSKLCKKDGSPVEGEIVVHIKEVTNTEEMMAANTPTMSDGRMLISGGSYFIQVKNNEEELNIKSGEALQIQLPNISKAGMELFYGAYKEDGLVNWQPANKRFQKSRYESREFTRNYYNKGFYVQEVKGKDTLGTRPATLEECYKIYVDSTYKTRWDYTRAHRDSMTYKEKMAYGLSPFKFPYERFKASMIPKTKPCKDCVQKLQKACTYCWGTKTVTYYEPSMYFVPDTVPVYKKDTVYYANNNDALETAIDYYEPMEITNLGWINCDRFSNIPISKSTEIQLGDMGNLSSCLVYYNFKKLNSLLAEQLYFNDKNATQCMVSTTLPIGEQVEIIILAEQDGKLVTAKKPITVAKENKIAFDLQAADLSKLKNFGKEKI